VLVSRKMLNAYSEAASKFLLCFLYRVGDVYSVDLRTTEREAPNPSLQPTAVGHD